MFVTGLFWIVAGMLERLSIMTATASYRDSMLSQGLGWAMIGLGIIVVILTFVTPISTRFDSGRGLSYQRHI